MKQIIAKVYDDSGSDHDCPSYVLITLLNADKFADMVDATKKLSSRFQNEITGPFNATVWSLMGGFPVSLDWLDSIEELGEDLVEQLEQADCVVVEDFKFEDSERWDGRVEYEEARLSTDLACVQFFASDRYTQSPFSTSGEVTIDMLTALASES